MADVEKIAAELRAAMDDFSRQPATHEGCRNALALFKSICSTSNIRALLDELDRLREALEPFAAWAEKLEREFSDHDDTVIAAGIHGAFVTFGNLRRARVLYKRERKE